MFCKYKNVLGKVKEGIHSYRIYDIAIMDVLFTIVAAFICKILFSDINFFIILFVLFVLGVFTHRAFCVRTTIDKILFD
tara:strand:- start:291 stop:527 length:237 start_codon:yes stop_codon:yes gene_type:complete